MQHVDFKPRGVCSRMIHIDLSDDGKTIEDVSFDGGCSGNLAAIGKLVSGRPTEEVAQILKGNTCGPRKTSCADQFSQALLQARQLRQGGRRCGRLVIEGHFEVIAFSLCVDADSRHLDVLSMQ